MNNPEASTGFAANLRTTVALAMQPSMLLRSLFASAVIWLLMASAMPSYSRLIFHGKLAGFFAAGLAIVLVSEIVAVLVTSLLCSDHATQVVPQSPTAVIQGLIAASAVEAAPPDMPVETLFAAVYLIIVFSAALTGLFVALLGRARAGGLMRFIPHPIISGFMAGLGWLILNAGFFVLVGSRLDVAALPALLQGDVAAVWLPAMVFALCILVLQARIKSTLNVPGVIIVSLILFYMWAHLIVGDIARVTEAGWFLPNVSDSLRWQLPDFSAIAHIDRAMLVASAGDVLTLAVVYTLNLFLRASAQELVVNRELDLNRECIVNGVANIASAFSGGGAVAYHAPVSSSLVDTMRAYGRLSGVILALMFLLTLLIGGGVFSLIPRFIPAGLLMYFGMQFMKDWLVDSWFKLPRQDSIVIVIIALVTALFGLLTGIAVGTVVAISFFVLEYSRINVIQQELSGAVRHSNLDRPLAHRQLLQAEGDKIVIFRLQGFVFFGTAYRFYEYVYERINSAEADAVAFVLLDFKSVRGFDVSALVDFRKLKRLADNHEIDLLISGVSPDLQPLLVEHEIVGDVKGVAAFFEDLDHALERCENQLLGRADLLDAAAITVEQQLAEHVTVRRYDDGALRTHLERIETRVGDTVFRQGDEADALYFIESGRVDVLLQIEPERSVRLRSMTAGTVIGEVGFYLNSARSASVVVTEAGVLQRLSQEALRQMEATAPQTATAIHVFITRILSDRLSTTNRLIQELMD